MNKVTLHLAEARGRNGWFRAREANVFTVRAGWPLKGPDKEIPAPYIALDISSGKGRADTSPVVLHMSREDAHKLGLALLTAVGGEVVFCLQEQDLKDVYEVEFPGEAFDTLPPDRQTMLLGAATEAVNDMDWQWVMESAIDAFAVEREREHMLEGANPS